MPSRNARENGAKCRYKKAQRHVLYPTQTLRPVKTVDIPRGGPAGKNGEMFL
jgi:hypothetical protein